MTRAERAERQAARLRAKREAITKQLASAEARQRVDERKARDKRRYLVGQMVDDAGLFAWTDADLAAVVQALTSLRDVPHPGAVLEGLLQHTPVAAVPVENGLAHPADGVAPPVPIGHCAR